MEALIESDAHQGIAGIPYKMGILFVRFLQ